MSVIFKVFNIFRIPKSYILIFFLLLYIGFEKGIINQDGITILFQTIVDFFSFIFEQINKHIHTLGS